MAWQCEADAVLLQGRQASASSHDGSEIIQYGTGSTEHLAGVAFDAAFFALTGTDEHKARRADSRTDGDPFHDRFHTHRTSLLLVDSVNSMPRVQRNLHTII